MPRSLTSSSSIRQADFKEEDNGNAEYVRTLREVDMRVDFLCENGRPSAGLGGAPPVVHMRHGLVIDVPFIPALVHEIGHTFGLADTYARTGDPKFDSTGGLVATSGKQPSSVMSYLFIWMSPVSWKTINGGSSGSISISTKGSRSKTASSSNISTRQSRRAVGRNIR